MVQKRVPYKRRREGKTNYKKRLKLVSSGKPRFIVRISNKYVTCQVTKFKPEGDITVCTFNSKKLSDYGFKGTKNLPSAYLAGLVCGFLAKKKGIKEAVLDSGLHVTLKGGRIFAALKGAIDSGLKIPHGEGVFPQESRLKGEHLKLGDSFLKAKDKIMEAFKK